MDDMTESTSPATAIIVRRRTRVLRQFAITARSAAGLLIAVADELTDRAAELLRTPRG